MKMVKMVGGTEDQALRAVRYTVAVFLAVVLALAVFAWRNGQPSILPSVGSPGPEPVVTPYVPYVPGPMDYYNECVRVGFAPYRCRNTYLP